MLINKVNDIHGIGWAVTKDDDKIKDWRSTGRKRARAVLIKLWASGDREYACESCGHVPTQHWTESNRSGDFLDSNHKNKDWKDNDPDNIEGLCRKCHYAKDRATEAGVSSVEDEYGYGLLPDF